MEKLSEYLPLLIIVGSIIYSVIRGASRKKAEELSKTTLPGHTSGEEIYFPETSDQEIFFLEMIKQAESVKEEEKKSKVNIIQTPVYQQKINTSPKKTVQSEPEEPETEWLKLENIDEVKKAVIYTEIFGRKEY
jgi:hypothetical protein